VKGWLQSPAPEPRAPKRRAPTDTSVFPVGAFNALKFPDAWAFTNFPDGSLIRMARTKRRRIWSRFPSFFWKPSAVPSVEFRARQWKLEPAADATVWTREAEVG
jgi:hypothetical protein